MNKFTLSVVVPTYQRPEYLERCVRSVFAQTLLPNELILISRDTDEATNQKINILQREFAEIIPVYNPHVIEAGFLPPISKGIESAKCDIVVFLDDDAEAFPDWLERIVARYDDNRVGGVGGRYVSYLDFKLAQYPPAAKVGQLSWYGRSIGNMYKDTTFESPVLVDFFIGGNMSFRRNLLTKITIDTVVGKNVAFHWELDVAQQIKRLGFILVFDPCIKVNHFTAPREQCGMRSINYEGVFYSNYNYSYLMMKHLRPLGKIAYILYTFLVGSSHSSGLLHLIFLVLSGKTIWWREDFMASVRGRFMGVKMYLWSLEFQASPDQG